jgi:hypothetical protein
MFADRGIYGFTPVAQTNPNDPREKIHTNVIRITNIRSQSSTNITKMYGFSCGMLVEVKGVSYTIESRRQT